MSENARRPRPGLPLLVAAAGLIVVLARPALADSPCVQTDPGTFANARPCDPQTPDTHQVHIPTVDELRALKGAKPNPRATPAECRAFLDNAQFCRTQQQNIGSPGHDGRDRNFADCFQLNMNAYRARCQ